jgi:membrane-associated protease RseP (regulator of RpoE activity)
MFGADFRIRPLFWVSCALLGVVYYQYPDIRNQLGGPAAFGLWMAAVLVSLGAHEMGHVLTARWFGARPRIVLSGLGDRLFGLEGLRLWQSVLVALAGPLVNLLLFGILLLIIDPSHPLSDERITGLWRIAIVQSAWLLMMINAFWALVNVLPLWPLDGGRIALEVGSALLGRRGQMLALLLSLLVSFLLSVSVVAWMQRTLYPYDDRYTVYFTYFCILTLYCYSFWLSAFRALWGDPETPARSSHSQVR